jgi:hypothetical protein
MANKGTTIIVMTSLLALSGGANKVRGDVVLQFNSLPSAQGWSYGAAGNSAAEGDVFSISPGVLHQDTVHPANVGFAASGGNTYHLDNAVDPTHPFVVNFTARVTAETTDVSNNHFGFFVDIYTGLAEVYGVGLGTNAIQTLTDPTTYVLDNTSYHNYRLEINPGSGYALFRDSLLISSNSPRTGAAVNHVSQIFFGDGTGGTNAVADVTSFSATAVPEPGSLTLLGIGGIDIAGYACRRRGR